MRSTINLDDRLMEKARLLTGTKETAAIIRQALVPRLHHAVKAR